MPIRWFPFEVRAPVLPIRETRLPLSPHCNPPSTRDVWRPDSLGVFHNSLTGSLASFAVGISKGDSPRTMAVIQKAVPYPQPPRKAGYSAHSVHERHRIAGSHPEPYPAPSQRTGLTSGTRTGLHGSRNGFSMPLESALKPQAPRGELPPSTHPKLGVQSKHHGFHRYALRRIFRPFLGAGSTD